MSYDNVKIYKFNGKYGLKNIQTKKPITPPKYDRIKYSTEGLFIADVDFYEVYLNEEGKEICPRKYTRICDFKNGLGKVYIGDKAGYINKDGKEVLGVKCDFIGDFSDEGIAAVLLGDKWVYINNKLELITNMKFDNASKFKNGYGIVEIGFRKGAVNTKGDIVLPIEYYELRINDNNTITFASDRLNWGLMTFGGELLAPPIYKYIGEFHNGIAVVTGEYRKMGFINKNGEEIIEPKYSGFEYFDKYIIVFEHKADDKRKFDYAIVLDREGKEIKKLDFDRFYKCDLYIFSRFRYRGLLLFEKDNNIVALDSRLNTHNVEINEFEGLGSKGRTLRVFDIKGVGVYFSTGCFFGDIEEFKEAVIAKHKRLNYETMECEFNTFGKQYMEVIKRFEKY